MNNLYIYAYPGQMITVQMVTSDDKILTNENCDFADIVRTTVRYLQEQNIGDVVVIGKTVFADKVAEIINKNLKVDVERV